MKNPETKYVLNTIVFCLFSIPNFLSSQIVKTVVYYDSNNIKTDSLNASYFKITEKNLTKNIGLDFEFYDLKNRLNGHF